MYYFDIASYQAGLSLSGMPMVVVKATEGTSYKNPYYAGWKAEASTKGVKFVAYHALHNGNGAGQATYAYNMVGPSVPLMLDWEYFGDNPSVQTALDFVNQYRALGGSIKLIYLPQWFWSSNLGSPSLKAFASLGCVLVASNYNGAESAAGWTGYGGMSVWALQFTSSYSYNGYSIDANNYHGTVAQAWADLTGGDDFLSELSPAEQRTLFVEVGKIGAADGGYKLTQIINAATTAATAAGAKADAATAAANSVGSKVDELAAHVANVQSGGVDAVSLASQLAQNSAFVNGVASAVVAQLQAAGLVFVGTK